MGKIRNSPYHWHRWFAWHPVYIDGVALRGWAFWEPVKRRKVQSYHRDFWEYDFLD